MPTITLSVDIIEADILAMGELRARLDADATRSYREWKERANRSTPVEPPVKPQDTRLWDAWIESGMPLPMHQPIGLTYVGD